MKTPDQRLRDALHARRDYTLTTEEAHMIDNALSHLATRYTQNAEQSQLASDRDYWQRRATAHYALARKINDQTLGRLPQ
jgi:hypothetical protein